MMRWIVMSWPVNSATDDFASYTPSKTCHFIVANQIALKLVSIKHIQSPENHAARHYAISLATSEFSGDGDGHLSTE